MLNILTWLSRRRFPYEPLITVEISRSRLINNLNEFKKIAPQGKIAPVLKSNAYGHGLFEVAEILEREARQSASDSIPFFVVDSYFEAVALRAHGIKTPLLIIGYTRPETMLTSHIQNVSYTISSLDQLQEIENIEREISIHLKIDTGMHRQGIKEEEIKGASDLITNNPLIILKGICSHLCDADNQDSSFTDGQINVWNRIVKNLKAEFSTLEYLHLSATDGHRYVKEINANVSRLGIGLYGLIDGNVFSPKLDLKPILEMKTIITSIKKIKRNDTVGYGNTFKADKDMTIATVPVGYFEGIDRRLSNNGFIEVETKSDVGQSFNLIPCPIIGRVSMNITSVDITLANKVKMGAKAIVISNSPLKNNSIQSIALRCSTIPYEIAVHIPAHLKRIIVS